MCFRNNVVRSLSVLIVHHSEATISIAASRKDSMEITIPSMESNTSGTLGFKFCEAEFEYMASTNITPLPLSGNLVLIPLC